MSKKLITKLRGDRDASVEAAKALLTKAEAGTELSDAEVKDLKTMQDEATQLDARIAELVDFETKRYEASKLEATFDGLLAEEAAASKEQERTTLADVFIASPAFTTYAQAPAGNSGLVETKLALIDTTDANSAYLPGVTRVRDAALPVFPTPLLDAMGYEPVGTNSIDWIEWPATLPVPSAATAEGSNKPEASYPPVLRSGSLDKIAHTIPVTREALQDIPRLRSIVEGALVAGVRQKAESLAAASLVAATLPTAAGASLLAAIRLGMASAQAAGWAARDLVLNPLDYAAIDIDLLTRTLNGAKENSPVWGLNVITAPAVTEGTAYVGDLRAGMTLYDRQLASVYMTDSHASEFIANILRILAEARMKAIVTRPEAIFECTVEVEEP